MTSSALDCYKENEGCLFDLDADPCEYYNVGDTHPQIRETLMERLDFYASITPSAIIQRGNELDESVYTPEVPLDPHFLSFSLSLHSII